MLRPKEHRMATARKPTLRGRRLVRALWRIVRIYWTSPDAKWGALLLAVAVALEFGVVQTTFYVSDAQRRTVEALEGRDASAFLFMTGLFIGLSLFLIVVSALRVYLRQLLEIRWRRGLTGDYIRRWIGEHAYGQTQLHGGAIDNPDQRIAEDIRDFVASVLGLSLSLLSAVATLISFGGLLWMLSSGWWIPIGAGAHRQVPGLLLWVAIAFSIVSMWLTHLLGRRLTPINYDRFRYEADFRYGLVRFRDHVEEVALSRGEAVERLGTVDRFRNVVNVFLQLVRAEMQLNILTGTLGRVSSLVPLIVAAPSYFSGLVTLGLIVQTRVAYDQVSGALSWFVNAYREIARWRANIERLAAFTEVMDATERDLARAEVQIATGEAIRLVDLRLESPAGRVLIDGANASVGAGERVAVVGPPGRGKTTLFRGLAGLWPFGAGRIERPPRDRMLFVPQRAYLPLGSLRAVVSYPAAEHSFDDAQIREALALVGLGRLADRLDAVENWPQQLSAHEQQLLAISRALLQKPDWLVLDEATSGLDEPTERRICDTLLERLPRTSVIAAGLRPPALELMPRRWTLDERDGAPVLVAA
jgi:vitamin B12/bleomycin/antimicrobial peptide transport system ATP-binding/permease protein